VRAHSAHGKWRQGPFCSASTGQPSGAFWLSGSWSQFPLASTSSAKWPVGNNMGKVDRDRVTNGKCRLGIDRIGKHCASTMRGSWSWARRGINYPIEATTLTLFYRLYQ